MISNIQEHFQKAAEILTAFYSNNNNLTLLADATQTFATSITGGGKIFSCGNGGSMCDAIHFAEELTGKFKNDRPAIGATAISDPGHLSCVANDYGYDKIFSRYLEAWAGKEDTLLAISTSGNSTNIIEAVKVAKSKGMKTVGLLGKDGGKLKSMVDFPIVVEGLDTERIQEVHIKCIHIFIAELEGILFRQ